MAVPAFPPVEQADNSGLLAIGGDLEIETLLLAYQSGIFPWPLLDVEELLWFAPPQRAILYLDDFHCGRSLRKLLKTSSWEISFDRDFDGVIAGCAESANRPEGTWITGEMRQAYCRLHRAGYAHSVECWHAGKLVGGLYGVALRGLFAGESMFYREANASKAALVALVQHLRQQGVGWIDCQVMTDLFAGFGAREIQRAEYMQLLKNVLQRDICLFPEK